MNKWKITSLVSVAAIVLLSSVVGWQLLNKPAETPETPGEPPQDTENSENTTQIEKPEFHIFDVDIETKDDFPIIEFKIQNLGEVNATEVVVNYEIKIGGDSVDFNVKNATGQQERIPFWWFIGNLTITVVRSKEVNEYSFGGSEIAIYMGEEVGITSFANIKGTEILESRWNVTCAEGVTETFDF